jgi:hypothetical protein
MGRESMKSIATLLIIVSLASLGGIVYPTVPIAQTSASITTYPAYTTKTVYTQTLSWTNVEYTEDYSNIVIVLNELTVTATGDPTYVFVACGYGIFSCTWMITHTFLNTFPVINRAYPSTNIVTETSTIGFAASGAGGIAAMFLAVALFLAGVGLLVRARKAISSKR